ncbi:MAG: hypothetical protein CMJ25_16155 [Phycisphaerae bacterium]|nr:hypothetical protein [Phycisphaerae bacterium]
MGNIKSKEWQQIFQQVLRMAILTQGLPITQLLVLGNQALREEAVVAVLQAMQTLQHFLQVQVKAI